MQAGCCCAAAKVREQRGAARSPGSDATTTPVPHAGQQHSIQAGAAHPGRPSDRPPAQAGSSGLSAVSCKAHGLLPVSQTDSRDGFPWAGQSPAADERPPLSQLKVVHGSVALYLPDYNKSQAEGWM